MVLFILLNIISFFRVIFVMVVIYYGFKMVMRIVAPKIVENAANKLFQDMKDREASNGKQTVRKGDVTIDITDKKEKKYKRADGDYIEFEEINDKK